LELFFLLLVKVGELHTETLTGSAMPNFSFQVQPITVRKFDAKANYVAGLYFYRLSALGQRVTQKGLRL